MAFEPGSGLQGWSGRQQLATDVQSLDKLKYAAAGKSPAAIRETAKQFESLFMRELVKSMRSTTDKSGLLDNEGTDLGNDLLDQQFAVQMSGQKGGLSDIIARQLAQQAGVSLDGDKAPGPGPSASPAAADSSTLRMSTTTLSSVQQTRSGPAAIKAYSAQSVVTTSTVGTVRSTPSERQVSFVQQHRQAANKVARESGIPASFMLGQAGHETGWGRHEMRTRTGESAHNLFGIKADKGWKGPVAEVHTTEYINGQPHRVLARFRAYGSYEESFRDYARLIGSSPRYAQVKDQLHSATAFASGLQRAGYATDPAYAHKLSHAIRTTENIQRLQA